MKLLQRIMKLERRIKRLEKPIKRGRKPKSKRTIRRDSILETLRAIHGPKANITKLDMRKKLAPQLKKIISASKGAKR